MRWIFVEEQTRRDSSRLLPASERVVLIGLQYYREGFVVRSLNEGTGD